MPHKHDRTNKRKSPKSSRCIRLRLSRTRGGSRRSHKTPQALHAENIGKHYARPDPHPILAMDPHTPEDELDGLNVVKNYIRNIKGRHVMIAVLFAMMAQLSRYEDPETVALIVAKNSHCSELGLPPYDSATQKCGNQIGPRGPNFGDRFNALMNTDENDNDTEVYNAVMANVRDINSSIERDAAIVKNMRVKLLRYREGRKHVHKLYFATPQQADEAVKANYQLEQDIARREKERDELMTKATKAEDDSRK